VTHDRLDRWSHHVGQARSTLTRRRSPPRHIESDLRDLKLDTRANVAEFCSDIRALRNRLDRTASKADLGLLADRLGKLTSRVDRQFRTLVLLILSGYASAIARSCTGHEGPPHRGMPRRHSTAFRDDEEAAATVRRAGRRDGDTACRREARYAAPMMTARCDDEHRMQRRQERPAAMARQDVTP